MKKAVLYARVSSSLQEKERTIDSQISELKNQIKKSGHTLVSEYIDDGYSGAMLSRPGMDKLRQDLKTNLFDVIYFHNADRIARDVTYQNIIIGEILRHKKQIIINGVDYIHNPENKFTLTVLGAVSELEKAKILERSMRGRQHKLKQGYLMSNGSHIYGYTYLHKTPESPVSYSINKEEAKIVKYIFTLYSKGNLGFRELVRHLNNKNIPCRKGRVWNWSQLQVMLKNQTYTGIKYFNTTTDTNALSRFEGRVKTIHRVPTDRSTWIGIRIPQIISESLFKEVQNRMHHNLECFRNAKNSKLLSSLVWCGICHKRCYGSLRDYTVQRKDGLHRYTRTIYRCPNKGKHNPEINGSIIEPFILQMIKTYLFSPQKLKAYLDYFLKTDNDKQQKVKDKLDENKDKIKTIQKQKKRIIDLYALGDLDREDYIVKINNYNQTIELLEQQSKELAENMPVFSNPKEIEDSISKYCLEAKTKFSSLPTRVFLQEYIEKIEYISKSWFDDIYLYASIPIGLVKLNFVIKEQINRKQALKQLYEKGSFICPG